jgi:mevalonate kinase
MAFAFGKVILVGEHAVVYDAPAIAVGVGIAATCRARLAEQTSLAIGIRRWELGRREPDPSSMPEARAFGALIEKVVADAAADVQIAAEVQLHQPSGVGLGASAAIGVALARAVSDAIGRPADDRPADEILAAVQAWEDVFHGKASGIDATTAYHGGCLWFRRSHPPEPLRLKQSLELAVAVAGPAASTRAMVESVAALKQRNERRFEFLIHSIHALAEEARAALLLGSSRELGLLLDRNHELLGELGVSTPALDAACQLAREAGALGAKLTGSGGGGCVVALTERESTEPVLAAWRTRGLHCFHSSVPAVGSG